MQWRKDIFILFATVVRQGVPQLMKAIIMMSVGLLKQEEDMKQNFNQPHLLPSTHLSH